MAISIERYRALSEDQHWVISLQTADNSPQPTGCRRDHDSVRERPRYILAAAGSFASSLATFAVQLPAALRDNQSLILTHDNIMLRAAYSSVQPRRGAICASFPSHTRRILS